MASASTDSDAPVVEIPKLGKLKGSLSETFWEKKKIFQFPGVKYGESPTGARRFKKAELVKPWKGVRDATKRGQLCADDKNIHEFMKNGVLDDLEDCLYLSVYSKNLRGNSAVMVYIPSSGYFDDKTEKPPNFLLEEDVVLVVPNYRTGILGFFSTKSKEIPGNAGFYDIILALEWVQNYIKYFGGDPNSVTVFGQGFGAVLADVLFISPDVPDHYFHKAILQSGSLLCPWAVENNIERQIRDVGTRAGCDRDHLEVNNVNKAVHEVKLEELLNEIWDYKYECSSYEPEYLGLSRFVAEGNMPVELKKLRRKQKPLMLGVTKNEGTLAFAKVYDILCNRIDIEYDKHNSYIMLDYITDFLSIDDKTGMSSIYGAKEFFTQEQLVEGNFNKMVNGFIDYCGTLMYKAPLLKTAQLHAQTDADNTFVYSFDYHGKVNNFTNISKIGDIPHKGGVYHSYENLFLFPSPELVQNMSKEDLEFARMIVRFWTSFAKRGTPRAESVEKWPAFTKVTGPVYHLDATPYVTKSFTDEFRATVKDAENGKSLIKKH